MTLAAHSASHYSVAALLTRPPRKTCSLRFRIEFALRLYHSNRAVAREYQKNIKAFAKISDNRIKFVAFSIRSCYNSFRTWGYSSVGRALASHVRGQGFDSPYLHHLPKTRQVRVFFLLCDRRCICVGRRRRKGGVHPDDAFYASVRLHAIAPRHIRVSPYPDGDRCKATPPLIWFHHLPKDPIVRVFFLSSRADGGDKGSGCLYCDAGSDSKERTETEKQKSSHENARKS